MPQSAEPLFHIDTSSPEPTSQTATTSSGLEPSSSAPDAPPLDLWMGIVLPGLLLGCGVILCGYEAFRLMSRLRIYPKDPDDDYEFHRFGWAFVGPLMLMAGGLQAVYSWEWRGAVIGGAIGFMAVIFLMVLARMRTRARELVV